MIYLDHASTTKPTPTVVGAMHAIEEHAWANPHSMHDFGIQSAAVLRSAEDAVRELLHTDTGRVIWTAGGAAANNLVLTEVCDGPGDLVTSMGEHFSIEQYRRRYGVGVDLDPISGCVRPEDIAKVTNEFTELVSIIGVNNETGCVNDLHKISKAVREKNPDVLVHSDIVQGFCKLVYDVHALGLDIVTLSAHKIYGPKGIGCLWVADRAAEHFTTYLGTPSVALVGGFHQAIKDFDADTHQAHVDNCESEFWNELNKLKVPFLPIIKDSYWYKTEGILALQFPGYDAIDLTLRFAGRGLMTSYGSACSTGKYSRIIQHMRGDEVARSTVRFSFGNNCKLDEMKEAAEIVAETIEEINNEDGSQSREDSGSEYQGSEEGCVGYCTTPRRGLLV